MIMPLVIAVVLVVELIAFSLQMIHSRAPAEANRETTSSWLVFLQNKNTARSEN